MTILNKTKIVATIGPACSSYAMLSKIFEAGANVARLNFSHGTYEDHKQVIQNIRDYNHATHSNIAILLDLQGPKLRVGEMENNGVALIGGNKLIVTNEKCIGTTEKIYVNYERLPQEVSIGERILLDDGKIELKVIETNGKNLITTEVIFGGVLSSKKGFNLPNTVTSLPCLTEKDLADLDFGLDNHVEWIGLSFVRKAADIIELKNIIKARGKTTRIIAKIEKPEGVMNFEEILKVTDGVMVARGDLGVEMKPQEVPIIQKRIISECIIAGKPVIVATQMLESMIKSPTPTRAEASDVANSVFDGADAVMLSAETSVGAYPVEAITIMKSIISEVEKEQGVYFKGKKPTADSPTFLSDEICFTACRMSDHLNAKAIIGMSYSGYTGYKISSFRPKAPIYIFTSNISLLNTLSLVWGVKGFYYNKYESTDDTFKDLVDQLTQNDYLSPGDIVLHTASMPIADRARTNTIKVSVVGEYKNPDTPK
jgi:pyruvate kinase